MTALDHPATRLTVRRRLCGCGLVIVGAVTLIVVGALLLAASATPAILVGGGFVGVGLIAMVYGGSWFGVACTLRHVAKTSDWRRVTGVYRSQPGPVSWALVRVLDDPARPGEEQLVSLAMASWHTHTFAPSDRSVQVSMAGVGTSRLMRGDDGGVRLGRWQRPGSAAERRLLRRAGWTR